MIVMCGMHKGHGSKDAPNQGGQGADRRNLRKQANKGKVEIWGVLSKQHVNNMYFQGAGVYLCLFALQPLYAVEFSILLLNLFNTCFV